MAKETKKAKLARFRAEGLTALEAEIRFAKEEQAEIKRKAREQQKRIAEMERQADAERDKQRFVFVTKELIPVLQQDAETFRDTLELGGILGKFEELFGELSPRGGKPENDSQGSEGFDAAEHNNSQPDYDYGSNY